MFVRYANAEICDILDLSKRDSLFKYGGKSAYEHGDNAKKLEKAIKIAKMDSDFLPVIFMAVHGDAPNNKGDLFKWGSVEDKDAPELLRYSDNEYIGVPGTAAFRKGGHVYETFAGKGFYKEHRNYDPSLAVGFLADAVPNYNVKGVEVLAMIDRIKDADLCRAIEAGYANSVSMGASVKSAICSICANEAHDAQSLCSHSKLYKGRMYSGPETGGIPKLACDDNRGVHFIELSSVAVPADPIANRLAILKVASAESKNGRFVTASIDLMEQAVMDGDLIAAEAMADAIIRVLEEGR